MTKIIAIGDIHGRDLWKMIAEQESDADRYVFIGDYFDTHDRISQAKQITNFQEIIAFKRAWPDQVVLLMGNHDFHYLSAMGEKYSGHNPKLAHVIEALLQESIEKKELQMAYTENQFLFTHAGVTTTWAAQCMIDTKNISESINDAFYRRPEIFKFSKTDTSNCGEHPSQSPIWVRPASLAKDLILSYHQIVGHTQVESEIEIYSDVVQIDALAHNQYLIIEGSVISIGHIEKDGAIEL